MDLSPSEAVRLADAGPAGLTRRTLPPDTDGHVGPEDRGHVGPEDRDQGSGGSGV